MGAGGKPEEDDLRDSQLPVPRGAQQAGSRLRVRRLGPGLCHVSRRQSARRSVSVGKWTQRTTHPRPLPPQVHHAAGPTAVRNHQPEGDVPVHTRGALLHALLPVAAGEAADRQPAGQDPGGQTRPGPHTETRFLHAGETPSSSPGSVVPFPPATD